MNLRNGFICLFFLLAYQGVGRAQTSAQVSLPEATVTAGDTLKVTVELDAPATCASQAGVAFTSADGNSSFWLSGMTCQGETTVALSAQLPRDLPGGKYHAIRGDLNPCPGYSKTKTFTVPERIVTVTALPDPHQYPAHADLELSVTQKQFFDTKIAQLNNLNIQITTRLEGNRDDNPRNRDFLLSMVQSAQNALDVTEKQYREQIMKSKGTSPAFFADFHAQYRDLLTDLNAPIPGTAKADAQNAARMIYAQLELHKRPPTEVEPSGNFSDTLPPAANQVSRVILDNASAYRYVKESGRITFDAELRSVPPGARIIYKKLIDTQFADYSSPTDVPHATFELAWWIFKFHKDGCTDDQVVRVNPYEDTHPIVSVEFSHCRGR